MPAHTLPCLPRQDLVVGKAHGSQYGAVVLDDCNFHECVNLDEFESGRVLNLVPPDGEFVVMNYRVTSEFRPPFRVFPLVEELSPYKVRHACPHSPALSLPPAFLPAFHFLTTTPPPFCSWR